MSEEREDLPKFDMKNIPLGGDGVKFKLDSMKPIEGESEYGTWHMWFAFIENLPVEYGRGKNTKKENNYSGKVIFFATDKLNEQLLTAANGKIGAEVEIKKTAEEMSNGNIMKKYVLTKLKDGEEAPSNSSTSEYTLTESELINDCKELIKAGTEIDENTFLISCKEQNINPIKGKKMYRTLMNEL
jgi:hypothetical protein